VPQSDDEALAALEGSPHTQVCMETYREWRALEARSRRRSSGRARQPRKSATGGGTLAVPSSAPFAVVFFCCLPNLFRIGEAAETSRDRPVGAEQGDDARIAEQVQTIACWQT